MLNFKVSIIIPVYNGSNYLAQAIESALSQSYIHTEIWVINDGSTDQGATEQIALSFGNRINYIYKENGGVSTALNLGIQKASGEYISWLSHDDLYYPNKLEEQIKFLRGLDNKNVIIFNDYEFIDEEENITNTIKFGDKDIYKGLLTHSYPINGCTLLIPKKAFIETGLFDTKLKTTQDYNMRLRMLQGGYKFINLPIILTKYRIHPKQDSISKKTLFFKEVKAMQQYILKNFTKEYIVENSGIKMNKHLIIPYIKLIFLKQNILSTITIFTQEIGLYKVLAPTYRRLVRFLE